MMSDMVGQTISHYEILEKLGGGGMGVVYKAEDTKLKRLVALKFLPPGWSHDETAKQRFMREAQAASSIDHSNICSIHEIDESEDGSLFIAMTYYEGETLKKKIERGPLPVEQAIEVAIQTAEGLTKAHAKGIVHRDIKPANLMVTNDGIVKIVDFGLAKLAGWTRMTKSGSTVGTVAYMSPEQTRGEEEDCRTDLWSLGIVLYEMLSGQLPFKGDYPQATIYSVRNDAPAPLAKTAKNVAARLENLVFKALSKDPSRRYQNAADMLADLRQLKHDRDSESAAGITRRPRFLRNLLTGKVAAAILAAAVLIALVIAFPSFLRPPPALALLPLAYEGPEENANLSQLVPLVVSDELRASTDLRVTPFAISRNYEPQEEPEEVTQQLGVDQVLQGRIIVSGKRFVAKLVLSSIKGDLEGWPKKFEGDVQSVLAVTDVIAKDLAAALGEGARRGPGSRRSQEALKHYLEGRTFLEGWDVESNYANAEEAFGRALDEDDVFAEAHAGLALALWKHYIETGEARLVNRALREALRAVSLDPSLPEAHLALGVVQLGRGRSAEAVASFEKVQKLAPANDAVASRIAAAYADLGREQDAERMYQRAIDLRPGYWDNYNQKGEFYLYKTSGKLQQAKELFREVIRLRPESDTGYNSLAVAHILAGELVQAEPLLRAAIRLNPSAPAHNNLGFVYYSDGRFEAALKEFRLAIETGPEDAAYYLGLGDAYRQLDRSEEARTAYERAVELWEARLQVNPADVRARAELSAGVAGLGNCEEARWQATLATADAPEGPYIDYQVAVAFAICEDREAALKHMARAIKGGAVVDVRTNPDLKPLLSDPSIREILR